jgi:hypothetical protein
MPFAGVAQTALPQTANPMTLERYLAEKAR